MKKFFKVSWVVVLLSCRVFFSGAQETGSQPYYFSLFSGLNMSRNLNIDRDSISTAFLPFVGININKNLGENSCLASGLMFSMKGSRIFSNIETYRFNYIDFHVNYKYKLFNFLEIYAGLQPSFLINAIHKVNEEKKSITGSYNHFELNIPLGVELAIQKNIRLGFAYDVPNTLGNYNNFKISLNIVFNPDENLKEDSSKQQAIRQIREMKNGLLFVRLQSGKKSAEALIRKGRQKEAEELIAAKLLENKEIIRAFRNKFKFCPVYFFYAENTDKLLKHDFNDILVNDSMKTDTHIILISGPVFIGEFTVLGQETGKPDTTISFNDEVRYAEHFNSGISAFVIMDSGLKILKDPFPFYVRVNELTTKRKYNEIISMLNEKLFSFYKKTLGYVAY